MAAAGKPSAAASRKAGAAATAPIQGAPTGDAGTNDAAGATVSADTAGALNGTAGDTGSANAAGANDVIVAGASDSAGTLDGTVGNVSEGGDLQSTVVTELAPAPVIEAPNDAPEFPRLVQIVNDTPVPYVVARHHVEPYSAKPVPVSDEDELARMRFECASILSISDHYKDSDPPMLRVADVE